MKIWQSVGFNRSAVFSVALLLLAMLAGCDTEKTRNLIDQRANEAQQTLTESRTAQPNAKRYNPLVVTDKVWAGNAAMRMHRGLPLPARYETPQGITIIAGQPLSLQSIASSISSQTGIPVHIVDPAHLPENNSSSSNSLSSSSSKSGNNGASPGMLVSYEGPLSGLLERVAGFFSVNWRFDGTSLSITRFETRVFLIEALPETADITDSSQTSSSSGSSSGGSSGGSGGGSSSGGSGGSTSGGSTTGTLTQNVSFTGKIEYWKELKDTLSAMLSGTGSIVTSPSSGEVTVTTTPELMRTISEYLTQENKRLSHQIAINVEVYSVNLSRDSDFNVSFTAVLHRLDNVASMSFTGAASPSSVGQLSGLGSLSIAVLNPDHAPKITDIFNALSTIGDTTSVAQFPMTTVNNRPVSRFVGTTQYFVPSVSGNPTTTTGSISTVGGSSATAQPIQSGLTLQLTPRLLDDGRIIMQYSLNIQDVESIQSFNTCTGQIVVDTSSGAAGSGASQAGCVLQEPLTSNRSFIQQSVLRSGSTLIIGGVDQETVGQNAQGVGDPFNWLLGGGTSNQTGRIMVFIAISPQVLDPPQPEQGL